MALKISFTGIAIYLNGFFRNKKLKGIPNKVPKIDDKIVSLRVIHKPLKRADL